MIQIIRIETGSGLDKRDYSFFNSWIELFDYLEARSIRLTEFQREVIQLENTTQFAWKEYRNVNDSLQTIHVQYDIKKFQQEIA